MAFSGSQKTRLGLSGFTRAPVSFNAKASEALVVIPGLEYSLAISRLHWLTDENLNHYSTDENRVHYKVRTE